MTEAERLRDATWEAIRAWRKSLDEYPRPETAKAVDEAIEAEIRRARNAQMRGEH